MMLYTDSHNMTAESNSVGQEHEHLLRYPDYARQSSVSGHF
jgi:hypothetical protein